MKVFVTKYALSSGIEHVEVEDFKDGQKYIYSTEQYRRQFVLERDAFVKEKDAIAKVNLMIHLKQNSLRRQLKKLDRLAKQMDECEEALKTSKST